MTHHFAQRRSREAQETVSWTIGKSLIVWNFNGTDPTAIKANEVEPGDQALNETGRMWFWTGLAWTELQASPPAHSTLTGVGVDDHHGANIIIDDDGDTKIDVEFTTDEDIVRIVASGVSVARYSASQTFFDTALLTLVDTFFQLLSTELTISSGIVVPTSSHHTIDTEADAATDDITDINVTIAQVSSILYLRAANASRVVTMKHDAAVSARDKIFCPDGRDFELSVDSYTILMATQTSSFGWIVVSKPYDQLSLLRDTDGDTKIDVEESADEDIIRMDLAGIERFRLEGLTAVQTSQSDTLSFSPQWIMARARGTEGSPTAVQSGDTLGVFGVAPYDGAGYDASVVFQFTATENHDATSHGNKVSISTVPDGATLVRLVLTVEQSGQVQLPVQGSGAGLLIGGDVQLYRSAANLLRTPDSVHIEGSLELDGDLNHDGSNIGFFGKAPASQAAAYTPTNVSADRSYNANATTLHELADVVGAMISDLQSYGFLQ